MDPADLFRRAVSFGDRFEALDADRLQAGGGHIAVLTRKRTMAIHFCVLFGMAGVYTNKPFTQTYEDPPI